MSGLTLQKGLCASIHLMWEENLKKSQAKKELVTSLFYLNVFILV